MSRLKIHLWLPFLFFGMGLSAIGQSTLPDTKILPEEKSETEVQEIMAPPCGLACMAVAFRLLDVPVHNRELDRLTDLEGASNLYDLCQYARSKGIHADVAELSPRSLAELDQVAILNLRPPDAPPDGDVQQHFVVFAGTDPSSGGWYSVDPLGTTPFTGLVDTEDLVRHWTGRALILSHEPLPWPLERGWWLRRWGVGALWWIVAPFACMAAVYALLSFVGKSGRGRGTRTPSDTGSVQDIDGRVA